MPDLTQLDAAELPESLRDAVMKCPLMSLGEQPIASELADRLGSDGTAELAPIQRAALWLLAGDLDRSHGISQSIDTPSGSFWHGVMHRREGDFGNAKYWFRRAAGLPIEKPLTEVIDAEPMIQGLFTEDQWDPAEMVDLCARASGKKGDLAERLKWAQWTEWQVAYRLTAAA